MDNDTILSLSLYKFSYATAASLQGNYVWTHLPQRDNLFAVFDNVWSTYAEDFLIKTKLLKLIRGGDVLEQINLYDLVRQMQKDEEKGTLPDAARLVIILVKKPLIALRYQLPNAQIRRMQMNFLPESGYDAAVSIFKQLGLPISDKNEPVRAVQPMPTIAQSSSSALAASARFETTNNLSNNPIYSLKCSQGSPGLNLQDIPPALSMPLSGSFESSYLRPSGVPSSGYLRLADAAPSDLTSVRIQHLSRTPAAPSLETLSQMLPPKRELPFPVSRPKRTAKALIEKEISGTAPVPKLLQANNAERKGKGKSNELTGKPKKAAAKRKVAQNALISPKTACTSLNTTDPRTPPVETAVRDLVTSSEAPNTLNRLPIHSKDNVASLSAPMSKKKNKTQSRLLGNNPDSNDIGTASDTEPNAQLRPSSKSFTEQIREEFMGLAGDFIKRLSDRSAQIPQPVAATKSSAELAAYAALLPEERRALVESLMCEYIMDDNFIPFCEDAEASSWLRGALEK